ncbi:MAG: hypothetical protein HC875_34765 [Anaerolineales bacterium]|nr:hypothetical protein [Anaerolineales bacterium]
MAAVAAEKNVEMATLVNAVLAPRTEQLNELVADGQLTQAEVDARITMLKVDIVERLNQSWGSNSAASDTGSADGETN